MGDGGWACRTSVDDGGTTLDLYAYLIAVLRAKEEGNWA
jgi:hypothetical protein